ncbi:hypothetical protein Ppa06_27920 [Planomonospora parontospora subsp. parontospora]|uniref:Cysteinyl-tRNA ligase anticodon binding domain-containing protein n=2 Tax=Planomonospora parontospora TaxID=58119 RepID=A0AA37BGQ1_9ACTN|nr:hypothetical protein [Planomonospora parontospora]GGK68813.1 hypothetical protein GCM10010126_30250 [Planomonospora parontospora]GII08994.1 hypothetical protein Ppa06_27920 [Planomonospora parontospora subsp. parontospora]
MLRLLDPGGRADRVVPEGARSLRMYTCAPPADRPARLGDLRPHLLADLVRRVCERHRLRVVLHRVAGGPGGLHGTGSGASGGLHDGALGETGGAPGETGGAPGADGSSVREDAPSHEEAFRADATALNLRPPEHSPRGSEAAALLAEMAVVSEALAPAGEHVLLSSPEETVLLEAVAPGAARRPVRSAPLRFEGGTAGGSAGAGVSLGDVAAAGLDPLAVRLALLGHRHREPVDLTWDALRAADRALRRRRARVAEWSESPSRPMPAERVARIEAAFDDDLDTPLALRLLDEIEGDESLAPGSRFEAFLHLDQVLGLDLPLDIGRPRTLPPGAAELLERRRSARESGDQTACDLLTRELAGLGVEVADTPQGQSWTVR